MSNVQTNVRGSEAAQSGLNVLLLNLGADTGGVLSATARAFRGDPEWNVRSLVTATNFIGYEHDLQPTRENLNRYWEAADLVHLHHGFRSYEKAYKLAGTRLPARPFTVTFHGTGFRENPQPLLDELRMYKAVGLTSTLDLYLISPKWLTWSPPPVNVEALRAMKQPSTDRVVIAHAPTNREVKSTRQFLEAYQRLEDEGYPVKLELIERVPWAECLARKARADIFFDQTILGYGCNALEAWGMGIPVVAGANDETLDEMERRFGHLPFYHATEDTIYDALKELVESPELREQYGQIGHDYVRKYHDEPVVVEQLKGLYRRAAGVMEDIAA